MLKYRLVTGVIGGGFRGVRRGSCTKIAITGSIFKLEVQHFAGGTSNTKLTIAHSIFELEPQDFEWY